jgi:hypothetical protein
VLPAAGRLVPARPVADPAALVRLAATPDRERWWRSRLDAAYAIMAAR